MRLQARFVVMGNVFPSGLSLQRKFDLKGSTFGRTAGADACLQPHAILKVQLIFPLPQGTVAASQRKYYGPWLGHSCCVAQHRYFGHATAQYLQSSANLPAI